MKIPYNCLCASLLVLATTANSDQTTNQYSAAPQNNQCADTTLYRELSPSERQTRSTPNDNPVLLSPHYCVGFTDISKIHSDPLAAELTVEQSRAMFARYDSAWSSLENVEQKVMFAHLFLKKLSKDMMTLPLTGNTTQLNIMLPSTNQGSVKLIKHNLTVTTDDHAEVFQGLTDLTHLTHQQIMSSKAPLNKLKGLIQWVFKGELNDSTDNQGLMQGDNTNTCNQYEQVCAGDDVYQGDGYDDFMAFTYDYGDFGLLTLKQKKELEEGERLQCHIHFCIIWWSDSKDYDEECLSVYHPQYKTTITHLYCHVKENP